jgi:hypothetical protein
MSSRAKAWRSYGGVRGRALRRLLQIASDPGMAQCRPRRPAQERLPSKPSAIRSFGSRTQLRSMRAAQSSGATKVVSEAGPHAPVELQHLCVGQLRILCLTTKVGLRDPRGGVRELHRALVILGKILDAGLDSDDVEREPGLSICRLQDAGHRPPTSAPHTPDADSASSTRRARRPRRAWG